MDKVARLAAISITLVRINAACEQNRIDEVRESLALFPGIVREPAERTGITPLGSAVIGDAFEVGKLLLERGADVHAAGRRPYRDGVSALYLAIRLGRENFLRLFVEHGVDVSTPPQPDAKPPLHWAALHNQPGIAKFLLNHGAKVNAVDAGGRTALHAAAGASEENVAVIQFLLDSGAQVDARARNGATPLQSAAAAGNKNVVQRLLDRGAEVDARDSRGVTAMQTVALRMTRSTRKKPSAEVIRLLAGRGATFDVFAAVALEDTAIVGRMLRENERLVHLSAYDGRTPLHQAAALGRLDIVRLLLKHKADADERDRNGETPLHYAVRHGPRDDDDDEGKRAVRLVIFTLWNEGANINAKDYSGRTPYDSASDREFGILVKKLGGRRGRR